MAARKSRRDERMARFVRDSEECSIDSFVPVDGDSTDSSLESDEEVCVVPVPGFVPTGLGAPRGLIEGQHVVWALDQGPLEQLRQPIVHPLLAEAAAFELESAAEELDEFRKVRPRELLLKAQELKEQQEQWVRSWPEEIRPVAGKLSGPIISWMVEVSGYPDPDIVEHCRLGFPFVGDLPRARVGVNPVRPQRSALSVEEAVREREANNFRVLAACKQSTLAGDIHDQTLVDAEEGFMTVPVGVEKLGLGRATRAGS